ncbi:MAG TPA: hypothetical protein VF434_10455 [Promineifilum sp.]
MRRILVVCTANICRSPAAAALLRDRLGKRGLRDWSVGSAGTWARVPRAASRPVVGILRRGGIDISDHQSTMVNEELLREADLVLTMEIGHAEALRLEFPTQAAKVFMLSDMTGKRFDIADPYGGPVEGYEQMVSDLSSLIDEGLDRIIELAQGVVSSEVQ